MIICYYSRTGNTKKMAEAIQKGGEELGSVSLYPVQEVEVKDLQEEEYLALGCPALGSEEIDHQYMEPLIQGLGRQVAGKKFLLFGSMDWGGGAFLRIWKKDLEFRGGKVVDTYVSHLEPTAEEIQELENLGRLFAQQEIDHL